MRKFLGRFFTYLGIPVLLLGILYAVADPFKVLRPFSLSYVNEDYRDYVSSELFLLNNPEVHYNSFIFGSSRCGGLNTWHWKKYLPGDARQYLFQSWSESVTGIWQKLAFLDRKDNPIDNVLIVLDAPGSFAPVQLNRGSIYLKDWRISGESPITWHLTHFYNFLQKPSFWFRTVKALFHPVASELSSDPLTNDYEPDNRFLELSVPPQRDSLKNCSAKNKAVFMKIVEKGEPAGEGEIVINRKMKGILKDIQAILTRHKTDYRILISPAPCYTSTQINSQDFLTLQQIFGEENVFDFSGVNEITTDCQTFSDPAHFDRHAGWIILESVYNAPSQLCTPSQ